MAGYKIISADTHVIEPPDTYQGRLDPKFRDRAPTMERRETPDGRAYDAWFIDGIQIGPGLGQVSQAGLRFENAEEIEFLGLWDSVPKGGYNLPEMIKDLEADGTWGACLQPTQQLFWYRISDSPLLSAISKGYNDWIAEFCQPEAKRIKAIGCLNVDNVEEACYELERCASLGLVGVFIPVYPLPEAPYRHPVYERLWWTAQDLNIPLLLHIGTARAGVPGSEDSINLDDMTPSGRTGLDYWVRYSLSAMIFSGVFDRYPGLRVGTVEHEMGWIPYWLKMMDFVYLEQKMLLKGWRSKQGMIPSDYWYKNMFAEFMEDDTGIQLRYKIGVDNMLWGSDYPHSESTWPKSMEFLDRILADTSEDERRKITSETAAKLFKFGNI